jgi:cytochrome c553
MLPIREFAGGMGRADFFQGRRDDVRHTCWWLLIVIMWAFSGAQAVAANASNGASLYANICAACHGGNPKGNVDFVLLGGQSPQAISDAIASNLTMNDLTYLTASNLDDISAYLATFLSTPPPPVPQAGYWYNPAEGGRGFTIEENTTSGNIFFATYLYTASGSPTWYAAGPAKVTGTAFSQTLEAFSGGQTLTGTYQTPTQSTGPGSVSITFSDTSHGTLTWPEGTIPIQRYEFTPGGLSATPPATQPQAGYWWNPAEGGRGYTIEVQNNIAFIAAYMYDSNGNSVWYASGPAALTGNNTYQGNWTTYTGGQTLTGTYQAPSGTAAAGSLTIQFTSPTAATLTLPDGRQIPIERYVF